MSSPSSPPPFSLHEFSQLVAFALDAEAERFPESCLDFDPELRLALSNRTNMQHCSPTLLASASSPRPMRSTSNPISAWSMGSPSRPRRILEKIKRQASAFVLRTPDSAEKAIRVASPAPTLDIPYAGTHPSGSSFFHDEAPSSCEHSFAPYVPLVTQLERAAAEEAVVVQEQPAELTILSRPMSPTNSPPPSPNSARSSTSSAADSAPPTPTSPTSPTFVRTPPSPPTYSPADAGSARWSVDTDPDDSPAPSSPTSSTTSSSSPHPLTLSTPSEDDPFAKGSVQLIRHSAHASPDSTHFGFQGSNVRTATSPGARSRRTSRRRTAPTPARPPPSGPLPVVPAEWTLRLGQSPTRSHRTNPPPPPAPAPSPSAPNPKELHIRVAPAPAFVAARVKKQDWTLSLPLDVDVAPTRKLSGGSLTTAAVEARDRAQAGEGKAKEGLIARARARSRSFLSTSSSEQSDEMSRPRTRSTISPFQQAPTTTPWAPPFPSPLSITSSRRSSSSKNPRPPRTADSSSSNASTESTESAGSNVTIIPGTPGKTQQDREREWARALVKLTTGRKSHDQEEDQDESENENRESQSPVWEDESDVEPEHAASLRSRRSSVRSARSIRSQHSAYSTTSGAGAGTGRTHSHSIRSLRSVYAAPSPLANGSTHSFQSLHSLRSIGSAQSGASAYFSARDSWGTGTGVRSSWGAHSRSHSRVVRTSWGSALGALPIGAPATSGGSGGGMGPAILPIGVASSGASVRSATTMSISGRVGR
ncbi:hypothetical protein H0H81_000477 [Sphagnurus paluster]|uniref:Uncharacterized protein n=1 Tax=Sphagnurus paluster TaxID=117069 RepID=A0A9P7K309_9AGAR|nr:hypothetical protein H0H81_000477 [Sphagnurus paluster]